MNSSYCREKILNKVQSYSEKFGYVIKEIEIHDENSPDYCLTPFAVTDRLKGRSIFLFSANNLKTETESIDCIDNINIRKSFPNRLQLNIEYKVPAAIWQNKDIFYFLTTKGDVMEIRDNRNLNNFILITGSKDLGRIRELLEFLSVDNELFSKISRASWIGDRRWDVIFNDEAKLMLPEDAPEQAWNKFIKLQQTNEDFKSGRYKTLDFRITNKIYVQ